MTLKELIARAVEIFGVHAFDANIMVAYKLNAITDLSNIEDVCANGRALQLNNLPDFEVLERLEKNQ